MNEQRDGSNLLCGAVFCWGLGLMALAATSSFVWLFKDGLGSDAVESHGLLALGKFWRGIRFILFVYIVPWFLIGSLLYRGAIREEAKFMSRNPGAANK